MNKFSDGIRKYLAKWKIVCQERGWDNFWEELRSEWWAYVKKNKLTMYEKVNEVGTNEGEVNEHQTIDCDIEDYSSEMD